MNNVQVTTEPLTAEEARWVYRSRLGHASVLALTSAACFGLLLTVAFGSKLDSLAEIAFSGAVVLLTLGCQALLTYAFIGIWRDVRSTEKTVVRGNVSAVRQRTSSYGLHISIEIGEKFIASDPLYSPVPGYVSRVKVGEIVEVSLLTHSRRTLSIVPG